MSEAGEHCWHVRRRLAATVGAGSIGDATVVNENAWLAAIWSAGSSVSASLIWLAIAVTVQLVPWGRFPAGVNVNEDAGELLCVNETGVPFGQWMVKALDDASTGSLNATSRGATATLVADCGRVTMTDAGIDGVRVGGITDARPAR